MRDDPFAPMSVFKKTINNFLEEVEENENIGEDLENEKVSFFLSGVGFRSRERDGLECMRRD